MSTGMAGINYRIDDELHRRAKIAAAMRGVSLKALIVEGLERVVSETLGEDDQPKR